jgi:hypothetical protein
VLVWSFIGHCIGKKGQALPEMFRKTLSFGAPAGSVLALRRHIQRVITRCNAGRALAFHLTCDAVVGLSVIKGTTDLVTMPLEGSS